MEQILSEAFGLIHFGSTSKIEHNLNVGYKIQINGNHYLPNYVCIGCRSQITLCNFSRFFTTYLPVVINSYILATTYLPITLYLYLTPPHTLFPNSFKVATEKIHKALKMAQTKFFLYEYHITVVQTTNCTSLIYRCKIAFF